MDVMRVAGLAMASAVVALVMRRMRPELGLTAALAAGLLLLGMALPRLAQELLQALPEGILLLARRGRRKLYAAGQGNPPRAHAQ